ncbi:class I SAM-dependent methyltransferase [Gelidibacter salicanalis]|uniref:Class I SAM-dependent methyltransferase n=1 Tax=Gelidibacter salicanalis TaxID=291193 RepID=A0A934KNJ7_9FLAO|nr:class I SAM-dependent methyltransferase [Gelidibacter salicanalis]MBJ7880569.1 class I SAM-dependent methyltransferase [Gelidibacter salicanalis]
MSYEKLKPLMSKVGCNLSPKEFQSVVNVVFHNYESIHYDTLHTDMRDNLQQQIDLLVEDLETNENIKFHNLKLLDVGCGTGLSTQLLLRSKLGELIDEITLLDTSKQMLVQAEKKALTWGKNHELLEGDLSVIADVKYDVILICSVLHHIPDLEAFLSTVNKFLNPNGILIHLQDPNNDYMQNSIYLNRLNDLQNHFNRVKTKQSKFKIITKHLKRKLKLWLGRKDYIDLVNDELLRKKIIKKRMSADEIWSVTDIHIESDLNKETNGISFEFLSNHLKNFNLVSRRTYGFFGVLKSELPEDFQLLEDNYISESQLNGRNLACVWVKN